MFGILLKYLLVCQKANIKRPKNGSYFAEPAINRMGRNTFYILSCGFAFFTLIFAFSSRPLPPDPWPLTSTKEYVRKNKLFLQNKANFQKVKLNVNEVLTKDYEQMDTWSSGKNKANSNPIQTQFKANTNPIQTQSNPILSRRSLWRSRISNVELTHGKGQNQIIEFST